MEIMIGMHCPNPRCGLLNVWQFGHPPIMVLSCPDCEYDGVLGDDRLLSSRGLTDAEIRANMCKRAERVKQRKEEAAKRFTEIKL